MMYKTIYPNLQEELVRMKEGFKSRFELFLLEEGN